MNEPKPELVRLIKVISFCVTLSKIDLVVNDEIIGKLLRRKDGKCSSNIVSFRRLSLLNFLDAAERRKINKVFSAKKVISQNIFWILIKLSFEDIRA